MKCSRSAAQLGALSLLASAGLMIWQAPAAHAYGDTPDGYASFVDSTYNDGFGGDLPECGSKNINGRGKSNSAKWSVGSSLKENAIVEVGDTWKVTATVFGFSSGAAPNDGPDPLILETVPTGPVVRDGSIVAKVIKGNQYAGDGFVGPVAATGPWGYKFDSNSSPNGAFEPGDGAHVKMTITMRATAPGVVALPLLRVRGSDATGVDSDFNCTIPVGWTWGVDKDEPPTSGTDVAFVDQSYALDTIDDANGGSHAINIDVLKDDDDPEVKGGPGDTSEVRIKDWQPLSENGGTVSCGTAEQKGETAFASMSVGPCTYSPKQDDTGGMDRFGYVLRSVTGLQTWVEVVIAGEPNDAPVFGETTIGVPPAQPSFLDLSNIADDPDGDPVTCIAGVTPVDGDVAGTVTIDEQCDAQWVPVGLGSGNVSFPVRVCDSHATRQNGELGDNVTRAPGYAEGSPDDTSDSAASRCADGKVKLTVNQGIYSPPNAGNDSDVVDTNNGQQFFRVLLDVTKNDVDVNGPDPSEDSFSGSISIADGPDPVNEGTAEVVGKKIRFTPAKGRNLPVTFSYRVCEDPAQQSPPYADDPDTPQYNEGLPLCGLAKVTVKVYGNSVPFPKDDEVLLSSIDSVTDFDVAQNDFEANGEDLSCKAGELDVDPALVESATIDSSCLVDLKPVLGAQGNATLPYTVCDTHLLAKPKWPANPYGTFLAKPGDAVHLCSTADLVAKIVAPAKDDPDLWDKDPGPTCVDDSITTKAGEPVSVLVLDNDSDKDFADKDSPLKVVGSGNGDVKGVSSAGGVVAPSKSALSVTYTPAAGFSGNDSFDYSAQDVVGHGCSAHVTVKVLAAGTGGLGSGGTTNGAGEGTAGSSSGTLPRTGPATGTFRLLTLSVLLLLAGAVSLRASRRVS